MAAKKKVALKIGDYVQVRKGLVGTVTGFDSRYVEESGNYEDDTDFAYVATVDQDGENDNGMYTAKKLTKITAPQYVVVWTDQYNDPFTQFVDKTSADKFVAKKRKESGIAEVRIYKLTK